MLVRGSSARTIVGFGTSFGISTLHLAAAPRDNGGGHLITSEFEPFKADRARKHLTAGGLIDLVEIREGRTLHTLDIGLPETIDMLMLDGTKALYPEVLSLLEDRLRLGAIIIADDTNFSPIIWSACVHLSKTTCRTRSPTTRNYPSASAEADLEIEANTPAELTF